MFYIMVTKTTVVVDVIKQVISTTTLICEVTAYSVLSKKIVK